MKAITERHVQAIWYDSALRPVQLHTRTGCSVRVVSPGEWNLGAGPDFRNAVLELGEDRRRVTGDVEIHLCPADWDFHRHGADSRYRNVIAHVTWGCGPDPVTLPSGAVTIWIGRFVNSDVGFSPEQIDLTAYPYAKLPSGERPCEEAIAHNPEVARQVLADAGRHRLRMKARRLLGRLCASAAVRRQIYYEETMSALGYRRNAVQFRHIAERIPIADLPRESDMAKAAMLVAGGFEDWDRLETRPNNSPERRLMNAADIFTGTAVMDFLEAGDLSAASSRAMIREMRGRGFVGRGRAAAIVANVVAPFALAEERIADIPDWLPPEDISAPVRLTAFRMFGRDHNPSAFYADNGLLIQGLLQVHRDYCLSLHPDCYGCSVVAEAKRKVQERIKKLEAQGAGVLQGMGELCYNTTSDYERKCGRFCS